VRTPTLAHLLIFASSLLSTALRRRPCSSSARPPATSMRATATAPRGVPLSAAPATRRSNPSDRLRSLASLPQTPAERRCFDGHLGRPTSSFAPCQRTPGTTMSIERNRTLGLAGQSKRPPSFGTAAFFASLYSSAACAVDHQPPPEPAGAFVAAPFFRYAFTITTCCTGQSLAKPGQRPVGADSIFCTTSIPATTLPNTA
jgi:hypothetical protein